MQSNHKVSPTFSFNPLVRQLLNLMICASLSPSTSYANPVLAQIVNGQVDINTSVPGTTTVTNSPNAIINWHNFDIKAGEQLFGIELLRILLMNYKKQNQLLYAVI